MKLAALKTSVTVALLAFVAISLAYAVVQEVRRAPSATAADTPSRATPPGEAGLAALKGEHRREFQILRHVLPRQCPLPDLQEDRGLLQGSD